MAKVNLEKEIKQLQKNQFQQKKKIYQQVENKLKRMMQKK